MARHPPPHLPHTTIALKPERVFIRGAHEGYAVNIIRLPKDRGGVSQFVDVVHFDSDGKAALDGWGMSPEALKAFGEKHKALPTDERQTINRYHGDAFRLVSDLVVEDKAVPASNPLA